MPPLSPNSPTARTLYSGLAAGLSGDRGGMAGGSLVSTSSLRVLHSASALRPNSSAPAPGSLVSTVGPPAPSDSALVGRRPAIASGLYSSSCASSLRPTGSVGLLPPALPQSSVAPAPPQTSGSLPPSRSPEPWTPPWPSGSSVSPGLDGSPSQAPPPPSVTPLESSAFPPPWLLPPSAPPCATIMAVAW
ncbi:hypothetical protein M9458_001626, partial [Cirrhinus mrigala]